MMSLGLGKVQQHSAIQAPPPLVRRSRAPLVAKVITIVALEAFMIVSLVGIFLAPTGSLLFSASCVGAGGSFVSVLGLTAIFIALAVSSAKSKKKSVPKPLKKKASNKMPLIHPPHLQHGVMKTITDYWNHLGPLKRDVPDRIKSETVERPRVLLHNFRPIPVENVYEFIGDWFPNNENILHFGTIDPVADILQFAQEKHKTPRQAQIVIEEEVHNTVVHFIDSKEGKFVEINFVMIKQNEIKKRDEYINGQLIFNIQTNEAWISLSKLHKKPPKKFIQIIKNANKYNADR